MSASLKFGVMRAPLGCWALALIASSSTALKAHTVAARRTVAGEVLFGFITLLFLAAVVFRRVFDRRRFVLVRFGHRGCGHVPPGKPDLAGHRATVDGLMAGESRGCRIFGITDHRLEIERQFLRLAVPLHGQVGA